MLSTIDGLHDESQRRGCLMEERRAIALKSTRTGQSITETLAERLETFFSDNGKLSMEANEIAILCAQLL